jgi:hypothetical protein
MKTRIGKWSMPYVMGPAGLHPLFWRDEQSGQLSEAVHAYLSAVTSPTAVVMTNDQFELFKAYCCYWVEAPCWKDCGDPAGLAEVRQAMKDATDVTALREALWRAGEFCLDPL